ncbi:MAG: NAD-dependent epimerase/dehydratase family protein [Kineosporiaceae bacterium]
MSPRTVVVTGLSGNLGTAVLRRLAPTGCRLIGVCRRPPAGGEYEAASWVPLDLAAPDAATQLRPVVEGADAVVHLAWGFQPSHDVEELERTAVGGTRAVTEAVLEAGVPHLVHTSSLGAYSPGPRTSADPGWDGVGEDWPTGGIDSLAYSRHKVAGERLLDQLERQAGERGAELTVTRLRPSLVVQRDAASGLLRYGAPAWMPTAAVRHVPALPLPRDFQVQFVHADDVAAAVQLVLDARAPGAFNLVAEPVVDAAMIAEVLGARLVPAPWQALRAAAAAAWHARLQPLDPGWLDLAVEVPRMSARRAREQLGWTPQWDGVAALTDLVEGMRAGASTDSPPLRERGAPQELDVAAHEGLVEHRRLP